LKSKRSAITSSSAGFRDLTLFQNGEAARCNISPYIVANHSICCYVLCPVPSVRGSGRHLWSAWEFCQLPRSVQKPRRCLKWKTAPSWSKVMVPWTPSAAWQRAMKIWMNATYVTPVFLASLFSNLLPVDSHTRPDYIQIWRCMHVNRVSWVCSRPCEKPTKNAILPGWKRIVKTWNFTWVFGNVTLCHFMILYAFVIFLPSVLITTTSIPATDSASPCIAPLPVYASCKQSVWQVNTLRPFMIGWRCSLFFESMSVQETWQILWPGIRSTLLPMHDVVCTWYEICFDLIAALHDIFCGRSLAAYVPAYPCTSCHKHCNQE